MLYIKTDENFNIVKFPYSISEFKRDNPETSWPETIDPMTLAEHRVYPVYQNIQPEYDANTEYLSLLQPSMDINGVWSTHWQVQRIPEEEVAAVHKAHRNSLLQNSDYTQLPDTPVDKVSWATYRQALRDVTKQSGWPYQIEWPIPPNN